MAAPVHQRNSNLAYQRLLKENSIRLVLMVLQVFKFPETWQLMESGSYLDVFQGSHWHLAQAVTFRFTVATVTAMPERQCPQALGVLFTTHHL